MPKDITSTLALHQNDKVEGYEMTFDGDMNRDIEMREKSDITYLDDIFLTPSQKEEKDIYQTREQQDKERNQAVRDLEDAAQSNEQNAGSLPYGVGSLARKTVNMIGNAVYGNITPAEENKTKEDQIRQRALLELDEEIKLNPSEENYARRESLNDDLGNHVAATQDFRDIVRIRPAALKERLEREKKSYQEGKYEESLSGFNRIIEVNSKLPWVHQGKATVLRAMGDHEGAALEYALEISKNPFYGASRNPFSGRITPLTKRLTFAKNKPNPELITEYKATSVINLCEEIAQEENSLFWYNELLKYDPNNPKLLIGRADKYRDLGRNEEALSEYDKILDLPDNIALSLISKIYLGKFKVNLSLGNTMEALDDLSNASPLSEDEHKVGLLLIVSSIMAAILAQKYTQSQREAVRRQAEQQNRAQIEGNLRENRQARAQIEEQARAQIENQNYDQPGQPLRFRDKEEYTDFIKSYARDIVYGTMLIDMEDLGKEDKAALLKLSIDKAKKVFKEIAHVRCDKKFYFLEGKKSCQYGVTISGLEKTTEKVFIYIVPDMLSNATSPELIHHFIDQFKSVNDATIKYFISENLLREMPKSNDKKQLEEILLVCADTILKHKKVTKENKNGRNYSKNHIYDRALPNDVKHVELDPDKLLEVFDIFSSQVLDSLTAVHNEVIQESESKKAVDIIAEAKNPNSAIEAPKLDSALDSELYRGG